MQRMIGRLTTLTAALLLASVAPSPALAQPGWTIVADDGRLGAVQFITADPGWRLNSRTDALIYQPTQVLGESFRIDYEARVFPSTPSAAGVFFAGKGLEPIAYDFAEVLIDSQGRYRVRFRRDRESHDIVPWTSHDAIRAPTDEAVINTMSVTTSPERLTVVINGEEVTSVAPPAGVTFDGTAGLRITSGLDVHVTRLEFSDQAP